MMVDAVLFAHQGGWDEVLLVMLPIALFALFPPAAVLRS